MGSYLANAPLKAYSETWRERKRSQCCAADKSTSEMQEGLISEIQLLPAHQQTPRTIDPRVQALHDPAARLLARLQTVAGFCLGRGFHLHLIVLIGTNMRLIVVRPHRLIDRIVVIACIQTQMLG